MLGRALFNVTGGTNNVEGLAPSADTTYGGSDNTHDCRVLLSPVARLNSVSIWRSRKNSW